MSPPGSRERVFRMLRREPADRIPVDFWASNGMMARIVERTGAPMDAFLDEWDIDFRYIAGPRYVGPPIAEDRDIWGVRRTAVCVRVAEGVESYEEVLESPLAAARSAADVDAYPGWPSADWFDYSDVARQCEEVRGAGRVAVFMGDRLNRVAQLKPAMYLRGMENILTDLALEPGIAAAIFARIRQFYSAYLERILDAARGGIDIVLTGDDFGSQRGLLVSADMWRQFLLPGFREYLAIVRSAGARSMHHTCGAVAELVPDLAAAGLDILQSLQPEAPGMDIESLVARHGDRICFQGGVSIQQTMPRGRPEDIRAEVERIAQAVRGRAGYIFCTAHNIQADTPFESVIELLRAYREFGRR